MTSSTTLLNPDREVIAQLDDLVCQAMRRHLPPGCPVALVDFPNHNNVGDTAIWLGELAILRKLGHPVVYVCDESTYHYPSMRARIGTQGVVLLHGGGNFGDVWPERQRFREQVIADSMSHPVVQLPQTVDISSPGGMHTTKKLLRQHGGVALMVRDQKSAERVEQVLEHPAEITPDSAFALGPLARQMKTQYGVLWLARTDHEGQQDTIALRGRDENLVVADWFDAFHSERRMRRALVTSRQIAVRGMTRSDVLRAVAGPSWRAAFGYLANRRLQRGIGLLSSAHVVVTDRLHGHILCMLLGMPHVITDNRYGKLTRFHEAFTNRSTLTYQCSAAGEAASTGLALYRQVRRDTDRADSRD